MISRIIWDKLTCKREEGGIFLDNAGRFMQTDAIDRMFFRHATVKETLLAVPLVLDRFINVVSKCFFEFEANCMNNLIAGSTDVNQAPRSTGSLGRLLGPRPALKNASCTFIAAMYF